jgi:hypothetical protein
MKTQHEFNKSKVVGDLGEQLILSVYNDDLEFAGGIINDFLIRDGRYLELKTDTYDMSRTPNFFMERYSDDKTFKNGGPWYADEKKSDVFLYFFVQNKKLFWFENIPALIERIEKMSLTLCEIPNKGRWGGGYNTLGFKVPRHLVKDLYTEIDLGDKLPI